MGKVSPAVRLGTGYAFLQVLQERPAGIPDFEEVKDDARTRLKNQRAMELARRAAEEMRQKLQASDKSSIELKTNDSFFRGGQLPEAGRSAAVATRAFELSEGELSEPLSSDNGYVVLRIVSKSGFSEAEFAEQRSGFEEQLVNEQRLRVWNAYVTSLTARYDVTIDWQAVRSLLG